MSELGDKGELVYDVAVVGAGFIGSLAAYHLVKDGKRTVLLDQFSLPHHRGSSYGYQRGMCEAVALPAPYVPMLEYSETFFQTLEESSKETLSYNTGRMLTDTAPSSVLRAMREKQEFLSGSEVSSKIPQVHFGDDQEAVYIKDNRLYFCDKVLRILHDSFKRNGGTIKDLQCVRTVAPSTGEDVVKIVTDAETVLAKNVVITAGPWNGKLLKTLNICLPLEVVVLSTIYFPEKTPGQHAYDAGFPRWFLLGHTPPAKHPSNDGIFLQLSVDYPGSFMVSAADEVTMDPDRPAGVRQVVPTEDTLAAATAIITRHFPGVDPTPCDIKTGMLTNTPDGFCVIDRHPDFENIVFAAGLSGKGFSLAPAIGKALSDLVQKRQSPFDLAPFRMSRFSAK